MPWSSRDLVTERPHGGLLVIRQNPWGPVHSDASRRQGNLDYTVLEATVTRMSWSHALVDRWIDRVLTDSLAATLGGKRSAEDALRLAVRHPETLPAFLDVIAFSERYLAVQQFDGDANREWIVVDTNLKVHGRFKTDHGVYLYAGADGQLWGIDYRIIGKEELISWRLSH